MATRKKAKKPQHVVTTRKQRYLIAQRPVQTLPQDIEPLELTILEDTLEADDEIELLERMNQQEENVTFIVSTSSEHAELLQQRFGNRIIIETDFELDMFDQPLEPWLDLARDPGLEVSSAEETEVKISVQNNNSKPVPNATVYLIGSLFPIKGLTDEKGEVTLNLLGEPIQSLKGLYIKPRDSYWSLWIDSPSLDSETINSIKLRSLSENNEDQSAFPGREIFPWGHIAMAADKLKPGFRGNGIKVAIIDSGLSVEHSDLDASSGFDFTNNDEGSEISWRQDTVTHGTHVAGTIAALHDENGIRGFAPEADLTILKIFPGGRFSDLIKSLDKCIDKQIDVINLSLGSRQKSELLQQKIQQAKMNGVACIAAVGNSGDQVQYPAAFPEVLAVSAIGKTNTFPKDSYHQRQIGEHSSTDGQYFSARFTCTGEEVDVCAPGVGILSTVPGGGYAAWDGTSMACPHVAGITTILLESRDDIRNMHRDDKRVDALFAALKNGCKSLSLPVTHQGAGMPSAVRLGMTDENNDSDGEEQPDSMLNRLDQILTEALTIARKNLNKSAA